MGDWEEIKRLAADFQRAQTSDTLQRISERNCIDIVKKLTDLKLIELIYTCDGKEFITPAHLTKEIKDEIYCNGGRVHLHDLASNLNVDYQHVENRTKELARDEPDNYSLVLGQVIHSSYKDILGKQIYDCMITNGQLSIADFAKTLDMPSEFLLTIVKEMLPKVMDDFVVSQDERTYYTTDMMDRYKSIIAGTLSAISKPATIASIMKRLDIPERIFIPIVDGLIKEGRIDASVENRLFIPAVYAREQNEWISKFYSSNSYIDYDVLSRMDIKQPKAFLKKKFPDGIQLKTCFISPHLLSQVETLVEDCIASSGWIDISTIVPSAIESDDIELLLQVIFNNNKQFVSSCFVFGQINICSFGYLATCKYSLNSLMQSKAQEHLKQGKLINHFLGGKLKEPPRKVVEGENEPVTSTQVVNDQPEPSSVDIKDEKNVVQNEEPKLESSNKKNKKDKKVKGDILDFDDSDEDQGGRKSKGRKSGGTQGREIKQKAVKKKYLPGNKGNQKNVDSDEDSAPSKTPRSNKGRAARRAVSPDKTITATKGNLANSSAREPLIFMSTEEIINKLKLESRGSEECPEELFITVAGMIEDELNNSYESLARKTLDDYLRAQAEHEADCKADDSVELVN